MAGVVDRMQSRADNRAELGLQLSLLAEHKITRRISRVTKIAKRMNVEATMDPELADPAQDVAPAKVLGLMEHHEREINQAEERAS